MADPKIHDIGKYRIVELVGEGAMGVVYKAVDSLLNRTVAIKVMNDAIARQEELRARFLREAQAAASLQHPNVVSIYDLGEVDGHLFIAMEYVPGADLDTIVKDEEAPLTLHQKLDIVIDVLTGLSFAHKRGIVHRDIKPANIRIGEDGRAKIMDFGVAHLASSKLTSTGASLGTPSYMAPEQITGGKTTPATDIFAVGSVLYELLTGVLPFDAGSLQNLFFKILTDEPRALRELTPGLPTALERIVAKAMMKDGAVRYQSALDMANDLSAVRASLSGPAHPTTVSLSATVEHAIRHSRQTAEVKRTRNRELAGAGALVLIALVVLAASQLGRMRSPSTTTAVRPDSTRTTTSTVAVASHGAGASPPTTASPPSVAVQSAPPPPAAVQQATAGAPRPEPKQPPKPTPTERTTRTSTTERTARATVSAPKVAAPEPRPAPPRVATAQSTAPNTTSTVTAPPPTVQQATVTPPRPLPIVPAAPTETPVAAPPPGPATAADVAPIFESYARAIEARDVAAIRRVYPGLTADQQRGFEQFFDAARKVDVTFRVASVEGSATSAEARVSGTYQYESSSGRVERQPVSFVATLRRDGSNWRLVSLR